MVDKRDEPFLVRHLSLADQPALLDMYRDFEPKRAAQGLPPLSEEATRQWLVRSLGKGTHLVVVVGGRIAGHMMLIPMEAGRVELANFLHQSIRNRGIGTSLNRLALELARDEGYEQVWLSVEPWNRPAVRSYEKVGFRRSTASLWAPEIEMVAPVAVKEV